MTRLRRHRFDLVLAGIAAVALVEAVTAPNWGHQPDGHRLADAPLGLRIVFALLWLLPLVAWRRSPLAAGVGVIAVLAVEAYVSTPATSSPLAMLGFLVGAAVIGVLESRARAVVGGIVLFGLLVVMVARTDTDQTTAGDVFVAALFAFGPIAAGQVFREHAERATELELKTAELERRNRAEEARAVADERARIASELHDVVAHGVSVMTIQAGAARAVLPLDPSRAREPILAIEQAGREALAETRRLLGILRADMSPELVPQPGIGDLDALREHARAADVELDVSVEGASRRVSPGLGLAAYRVLADACAAPGASGGTRRAAVVRWLPDVLELEVTLPGPPDPEATARLLTRSAERIRIYGGTLETSIDQRGAAVFTARLPLEDRS